MFQFSVFFEDHGFETDEYCDEQGMLNVFANIKYALIHPILPFTPKYYNLLKHNTLYFDSFVRYQYYFN